MAQDSDVAQATPDLGRRRKVLIDMSNDEVRRVKCLLLSGPMDTVQDAVSQVEAGLRRTARTDVPELAELEIFEPDFSTWVDFDDIALLPEGSKRQLRRKQAPLAAASPLGGGSAFAPEAIARRAKLKRGAVVAKVGYKVENVGEIDCHKSVFFASVKVFLQWNEPELVQCTEEEIERLEDAPGWKGMTAKHSNPLWEKLHFFHPDLQVLNLHTHLRCSSAIQVKDKQKGTVKMAMYICDWLELDVGGALRNFPFDYHDLRLSLRSHKLNTGSLRLAKWSGMHTAEFQEQQNEWQLAGHRGDLVETDPNTSSTGKTYHEFHVVVMVRRYYSWYVWNVGIYMMALFAMSMAMYMMPVENIGDRAETSVALSKCARAPCVLPPALRRAIVSIDTNTNTIHCRRRRCCLPCSPCDHRHQVCGRRPHPALLLRDLFRQLRAGLLRIQHVCGGREHCRVQGELDAPGSGQRHERNMQHCHPVFVLRLPPLPFAALQKTLQGARDLDDVGSGRRRRCCQRRFREEATEYEDAEQAGAPAPGAGGFLSRQKGDREPTDLHPARAVCEAAAQPGD